jgi:hypothetical protein
MDKNQETQEMMMTPKKVRGTATIYSGGDIDFRAQGEGKPVKNIIKRKGNSQFYETTSGKPKLCAHIMCDKDDPAAASKLQAQLDDFLEGFGEKSKIAQPRKKDRMLWDSDGLRVWYRSDKKNVEIALSLPLNEGMTMEQQALKKFQTLYQCFSINRQFLLDVLNALRKNGKG